MKTVVTALISEIHDLASKVEKVDQLVPGSSAWPGPCQLTHLALSDLLGHLREAETDLTESLYEVPKG